MYFRGKGDQILGFQNLTERRIKAHLDKCEAIIQMSSSTSKKEIQRLNDMLTSLNKFISKSAQHALCFYGLLKNKFDFKWTTGYEEAFKSLKKNFAKHLVLTQPSLWKFLYLYLVFAKEAVSFTLIRESDAY